MSVEATTMGDLIRWDQLSTIDKICKRLLIDGDGECRRVFQCKTEDLSVSGADQFIAHLNSLEQERKTA